jgi:hypothetical protein
MKKHLYSLYQSRHISMNLFLLTPLLRCNGAQATRWLRSRECNINCKLKFPPPPYSLTGERRNRFKHCDHKRPTSNSTCQGLELDCSSKRETKLRGLIRHHKEWRSNHLYLKHEVDNKKKHAAISLSGRQLWLHSSAILQHRRFLASSSPTNMRLQFQVPRFIITKNRLTNIKSRLT